MDKIPLQTGANIDTRTPESKEKDYMFNEIVASADAVNWFVKPEPELRLFPVLNQSISLSCVAQTIAKMAIIHIWLREQSILSFSATGIYTYRSNKPEGGMIGVESFDIWIDKGIPLEALVPSQMMTDQAMDAQIILPEEKEIAKYFAPSNHIGVNSGDIEAVASIIQRTKKPVMVWYYFNHDEWSQAVPKVLRDINLYAPTTSRHSVTAVDFTLLPDGRKALVIEDSSHFGGLTRRYVTEDFHKKRNFFARYAMNFMFEGISLPGTEKLTITLRQGMKHKEVVILQDFLKEDKLFPSNVDSTGFFGAITKKALQTFQASNNLIPDGIVGRNTRTVINKMMS